MGNYMLHTIMFYTLTGRFLSQRYQSCLQNSFFLFLHGIKYCSFSEFDASEKPLDLLKIAVCLWVKFLKNKVKANRYFAFCVLT